MSSQLRRRLFAMVPAVFVVPGCGFEGLPGPAGSPALSTDPPPVEAQAASEQGSLTVDAGPDLIVASHAVAVLRGRATHHAAGAGFLSFHWIQTAGPGTKATPASRVVLGQKLVIVAPTGPTALAFQFWAADGAGESAADECQITVLAPGASPPEPPPVTVVMSGDAAWLDGSASPFLRDFDVDFLAEGIDPASDVLEVISGFGATPGIYGITGVNTSELYLDADAGQSVSADVAYRVLRP